MHFDPDRIDIEKPEMKKLITQVPDDFNKFAKMGFKEFIELDEGWYWGTTISGIPHGYGAMLYKEGINYHKEILGYWKENMNRHTYVYYEGMFMHGKLNGPGSLKLKGTVKKLNHEM